MNWIALGQGKDDLARGACWPGQKASPPPLQPERLSIYELAEAVPNRQRCPALLELMKTSTMLMVKECVLERVGDDG